jgi:tetratricopeptide (TPR) repeat protein
MNFKRILLGLFMLVLLALNSCKSHKKIVKDGKDEVNYEVRKSYNEHYYEGAKFKILGDYTAAIGEFKLALLDIPNSHEAMYQLGNIYFKDKKLEEAIHWAEKAVKANSKYNFWYFGQLAQMYSTAKMYEKSSATFALMVDKEPERRSNYEEAGNQFLNAKKPKEAIKYFEKCITKFGPNEELCRKLEDLYFDLNQPNDAIRIIKKLSDSNPNDVKFLGLLAESLTKANKIVEAKAIYNKILSLDEFNGYASFGMADVLRKEGNYDESFKYLSVGFADKRVNIQHKLKVISSYYYLINKDEKSKNQAIELSQKLIESHPDDATAYQVYSDILFAIGEYLKSREYLKTGLLIDGKDYRIWQKLFGIDLRLNNDLFLYEDSKLALDLFATQTSLFMIHSQAALNLKFFDNAIDCAIKGLDIAFKTDEKIQLLLTMGDAWYEKGDNEKADQYFNKALEIDQQNALALNNYAYNLFKRNQQLQKAEEMIIKALAKEPNSGSYADTYGCILMANGKLNEAEIWLKKSLQLEGENAEILEHLGDLYVKQGKNNLAIETYKKALQLDPKNKAIELKLGKLG